MAMVRSKKDRSTKDMLTKPTAGKAEAIALAMERHECNEEGEGPIMRAFHEGLLTSRREDLQAVKRELSQDLLLQLEDTLEECPHSLRSDRQRRRSTRWQAVLPKSPKPDPGTMASEQRVVQESQMGDAVKPDGRDIKLLMGILAFRLDPLMPGLMDPDQASFIPRQQCGGNTNQIMHILDKAQRSGES
ncbi:hypothetical protein NDU88_007816 [Pleurodeles waltl]|uniref:Uncharacterized protein n=1 Tax=Pleurodeles waltl TaxID=8319 RepID=A0AAV7RUB2_PLEWA|nr:hypothetical protein NDU88_007816 [Pleurodeles waltl]